MQASIKLVFLFLLLQFSASVFGQDCPPPKVDPICSAEFGVTDFSGLPIDLLPPGIFLQLLELMPQLEMPEMMAVHQQVIQQAPPGQILILARDLATN